MKYELTQEEFNNLQKYIDNLLVENDKLKNELLATNKRLSDISSLNNKYEYRLKICGSNERAYLNKIKDLELYKIDRDIIKSYKDEIYSLQKQLKEEMDKNKFIKTLLKV